MVTNKTKIAMPTSVGWLYNTELLSHHRGGGGGRVWVSPNNFFIQDSVLVCIFYLSLAHAITAINSSVIISCRIVV